MLYCRPLCRRWRVRCPRARPAILLPENCSAIPASMARAVWLVFISMVPWMALYSFEAPAEHSMAPCRLPLCVSTASGSAHRYPGHSSNRAFTSNAPALEASEARSLDSVLLIAILRSTNSPRASCIVRTGKDHPRKLPNKNGVCGSASVYQFSTPTVLVLSERDGVPAVGW